MYNLLREYVTKIVFNLKKTNMILSNLWYNIIKLLLYTGYLTTTFPTYFIVVVCISTI
jgi:hypothetical protein